jgi:hypothetical protein
VLERHGLYDACIVGGGDRALAAAALGHFDGAIGPLCFNERQARHYLAWAEPFFRAVGGRVGGVEGTVYHAWHGEWPNRAYRQRTEGLRAYGFDPHVDIAPGARGCWRWSSAKPELHAYVRGYFERRREDGDAA